MYSLNYPELFFLKGVWYQQLYEEFLYFLL